MKKEKHYRVVTDDFAGFEVQEERKFLWFKWWVQSNRYGYKGLGVNTFGSVEKAMEWIKDDTTPIDKFKSDVVWDSEISTDL